MEQERFFALCKEFDIFPDFTTFGKLLVYFNTLTEWNEKINLTTITDQDEVFIKHFLDSMAGAAFIPQNASVCDIGTGAGFPGVVLKLIRPDINLTLIDSLNKRITFLQELIGKLDIKATCMHARAEDAGRSPQYRDKFSVVVSRAVAKLNTLYEYALPLVAPNGLFIAYKAHCEEELTESEKVPHLLNATIQNIKRFTLPPEGDTRTLIVVKKLGATPKPYPRGKNRERNDPLK